MILVAFRAGFGASEIREAMGVTPALHAWVLRPFLEIQRVTTDENHPVDRARAFARLAEEFKFKHHQIADKVPQERPSLASEHMKFFAFFTVVHFKNKF